MTLLHHLIIPANSIPQAVLDCSRFYYCLDSKDSLLILLTWRINRALDGYVSKATAMLGFVWLRPL